jgi:hypothetical protein
VASSQAILNDIDLRYRNTFSVSQKLVWFNEEQSELFDILEIDSPPYAFTTVQGENFYPFPDQFDVTKIKVVNIQINDDTNFLELPFERNDNNEYAAYGYPWYSIVSNAFYLNYQQDVPGDRLIYIYTDSDPQEVTTANITSSPDTPVRYQEILKLGILKRIAGARKDIQMRNSYDAEYQEKVSDVLFLRKMKEPEFTAAVDMMPRGNRGRNYYGSYYGR